MTYRPIVPLLLALACVMAFAFPSGAAGPGSGATAATLSSATGIPDAMAGLIRAQVQGVGAAHAQVLQAELLQREVIAGDVAHYTISVRTGPGKYDRIRVHRVVRETRPGVPIRTSANLFYQHGDLKDFVGMLLPGLVEPSMPRDFGLATYLAHNDVDVWGIDQDWTLVPGTETDLSFMSSWGLGRAMNNLDLGIAVARAVRFVTGSGADPMLLAGYSSGGFTAAALLDHETQLPVLLRQVNGYVNVDIPLKTSDPAVQAAVVADYATHVANLATGTFGEFQPFQLMGQLAANAPDDPSPLFPGFTNYQVPAYITLAPGGTGWPSPIHYWAGNFDNTGFPTGPRLTTKDNWLQFLEVAITWQPARFFKEYEDFLLAPLNGLASPFDDHLASVRVPLLNVAATGGVSGTTHNGMAVFGSTDVTEIRPTTGSAPETDIGHVDLFTWTGSQDLVWHPLLTWINGHTGNRRGNAAGALAAGTPEDGSAVPAPVATDAFGIRRIEPNPASGPIALEFALPGGGVGRLEVLDVAGRVIEAQDLGAAGSRVQQARLGTTRRLAPGIYLVRLSQAGRSWSRRVAVVN